MNRQQDNVALGLTGLAGCAGGSDSDPAETPAPTPTPAFTASPPPTATRTPSPTATPTIAGETSISEATLVYRWDQFGDVRGNAINGAGAGVTVLLGARFTLTARDGEIDGRVQFRVTDDVGNERADEQAEISELISEDKQSNYEQTVGVDTSGWGGDSTRSRSSPRTTIRT